MNKEQIQKEIIESLQTRLWTLEDKLKMLESERYESEKSFREKQELKKQIAQIKEQLFMKKYTATNEKIDKHLRTNSTVWGLRQQQYVKIVDNAETGNVYWEKQGESMPAKRVETITILDCGVFRACDQKEAELTEKMLQVPFKVVTKVQEDGTQKLTMDELSRKYNHVKETIVELRVAKVILKGKQEIEYFMMYGVEKNKNLSMAELQKYMLSVYTSNAFQELVMHSLQKGEYPYTGTITKNKQSKMELKLYDRCAQAVHRASNCPGIYKSADGKTIMPANLTSAIDAMDVQEKKKETLQALQEKNLENIER